MLACTTSYVVCVCKSHQQKQLATTNLPPLCTLKGLQKTNIRSSNQKHHFTFTVTFPFHIFNVHLSQVDMRQHCFPQCNYNRNNKEFPFHVPPAQTSGMGTLELVHTSKSVLHCLPSFPHPTIMQEGFKGSKITPLNTRGSHIHRGKSTHKIKVSNLRFCNILSTLI